MTNWNAVIVWAFAAAVISGDAVSQEKAPWRWSHEERVAKRLDPVQIAARRSRRIDENASSAASDFFVIDGAVEPELFLPWELLDMFFSRLGTDPGRARASQASYAEALALRGWDASQFWRDIAEIRADYDAARATQAPLFVASGTETVEEKRTRERRLAAANLQICRARADAFRAALSRYRDFDRFLYEAVAPTLVMRSATPTDAATLQWIGGGCK